MWQSSWEILSCSVFGGDGGWLDTGIVSLPESGNSEMEKLSSDQQMLSRRKAAVARRLPVWRRSMASSIRPRWQQAWPRTKYLHLQCH